MKKLLALLLMVIMSVTLLSGCLSDPVADDLENYLNVEMIDVNLSYARLTDEVAKWEGYEDDSAILASINDILLPNVNNSITMLKDINPETEEVKAIKNKYVKVMEAYKEAFEALAEGCVTQEEAIINKGNESIEKALGLLDEYNKSLEELAKEHGMEIEY